MEIKAYTWKELTEYLETEEGKAESRALEVRYRDGYFDGVKAALAYLYLGADYRQLDHWLWQKLFDWRYRSRCEHIEFPPTLTPWPILRKRILERDHFQCVYCGGKANHVDHVIPVCQGGSYEENNLVAACASCNFKKGKKTPEQAGMKMDRNA